MPDCCFVQDMSVLLCQSCRHMQCHLCGMGCSAQIAKGCLYSAAYTLPVCVPP